MEASFSEGASLPQPIPLSLVLNDTEQRELENLLRRHNTAQQIALRAKIILLAHQGHNNYAIASQLHLTREMVRLWRNRWVALQPIPLSEKSVLARLEDTRRPGAPAKISAEAYCRLMVIACQPPDEVGRPITHWTNRELADEAIKQQVVKSISPRQVGRFLKRSRS